MQSIKSLRKKNYLAKNCKNLNFLYGPQVFMVIFGQFSKGRYRTHITTFSLKNKKISFSLTSNFVFTESFSSLETGNDAFYYKNVV